MVCSNHSVVGGGFEAIDVLAAGQVEAPSLVSDRTALVSSYPFVLLLHAHFGLHLGREHCTLWPFL